MKTTAFSILKGASRIAGLTGNLDKKNPNYSDQEALLQDWKTIGKDMEKAIRQFEKEYGQRSDKKK